MRYGPTGSCPFGFSPSGLRGQWVRLSDGPGSRSGGDLVPPRLRASGCRGPSRSGFLVSLSADKCISRTSCPKLPWFFHSSPCVCLFQKFSPNSLPGLHVSGVPFCDPISNKNSQQVCGYELSDHTAQMHSTTARPLSAMPRLTAPKMAERVLHSCERVEYDLNAIKLYTSVRRPGWPVNTKTRLSSSSSFRRPRSATRQRPPCPF
jgi:hypothetical protein